MIDKKLKEFDEEFPRTDVGTMVMANIQRIKQRTFMKKALEEQEKQHEQFIFDKGVEMGEMYKRLRLSGHDIANLLISLNVKYVDIADLTKGLLALQDKENKNGYKN